MSVWGLIMAKARASFTMTDIFDKSERQKKSNKIFYICILIAFAQILKSCAENDYAEKFINKVEHQLDDKVFNINNETKAVVNVSEAGHHHGPKVKSAKSSEVDEISVDQIIDKRHEELTDILKSETVDDITIN